MDVTRTALSGLNAADRRMGAAAANLANARTPGYAPVDVALTAQAAGGVRAETVVRNPASVPRATESDTQDMPNVSPEREMGDMLVARNDYEATARLLNVQKELDHALLDIQA